MFKKEIITMKEALIVLLSIGIAGCSGFPTKEGFDKEAASFYGKHVDSVVEVLGPPKSIYKLKGGGAIYTFSEEYTGYVPHLGAAIPQYGTASTTVIGNTAYTTYSKPSPRAKGHYERRSCVVRYKVDPAKIIKSHTSKGNSCRGVAPTS